MKIATEPLPKAARNGETTHRFSVAQYLRMVEVGILGEDDKVELLSGRIVPKMARNPSHDSRLTMLLALMMQRVPDDWIVRCQMALVLRESVPEPDLCVVVGPIEQYRERRPCASDVGVVIEVANSSLGLDREEKLSVYARSGVPVYWIVNLIDEVIEEYSDPRNGRSPGYRSRKIFHPSDTIVVRLGSRKPTKFRVSEILMLS